MSDTQREAAMERIRLQCQHDKDTAEAIQQAEKDRCQTINSRFFSEEGILYAINGDHAHKPRHYVARGKEVMLSDRNIAAINEGRVFLILDGVRVLPEEIDAKPASGVQ